MADPCKRKRHSHNWFFRKYQGGYRISYEDDKFHRQNGTRPGATNKHFVHLSKGNAYLIEPLWDKRMLAFRFKEKGSDRFVCVTGTSENPERFRLLRDCDTTLFQFF